jgi:RNA polymerase primary sigma factor
MAVFSAILWQLSINTGVTMPDLVAVYLKQAVRHPRISRERAAALAKCIREGEPADAERARHELVCANLRLVPHVAKRCRGRGMPFADLIQCGNLGLMKAASKYDERLGYAFATYAYWWIWQSISRAIGEQSRTIRLPVYIHERVNRVFKVRGILQHKLGREVEPEEVAAESGLPLGDVNLALSIPQEPLSFDAPHAPHNADVAGDDGTSFADTVASDGESPADAAVQAERARIAHEALQEVTPRQREVLCKRFGIGTDDSQTLDAIGGQFGVTRERIRQIEARSLAKLRQSAAVASLAT